MADVHTYKKNLADIVTIYDRGRERFKTTHVYGLTFRTEYNVMPIFLSANQYSLTMLVNNKPLNQELLRK
jgi:hypothetical protein